MIDDVISFIRDPFMQLSGTPVSVLSVVTALAIIIAARVIAGLIARNVQRIVSNRSDDRGAGFAVGKIIRWLGTVVGLFIGLNTVGINMDAALAVLAVLMVGIGFGLQKMAENFISGIILLVERPIQVGDFIAVEGARGTVEDIGLRATRVLTRDGVTVVVPNSEFVSKALVNYTGNRASIRVWVNVGVAYGSNLKQAKAALLAAAGREVQVLPEPAPLVALQDFGDSSIDLSLVVWIDKAPDDMMIMSRLRFHIEEELASRNIAIPFPQRDLHIKSMVAPTLAVASRDDKLPALKAT